jgi:hypothetical protein
MIAVASIEIPSDFPVSPTLLPTRGDLAEELPELLNLRQAIALLAFGDPNHSLEPDRIVAWTYHPASAEGTRRWTEYNRASAAFDSRVRQAIDLLCDAIAHGNIKISGDLLVSGVPCGDHIDCSTRNPIPVGGRPCKVPREWLCNRGGWICVQDAQEANPKRNEYFCYIRIAYEDLTNLLENAGLKRTRSTSTVATMRRPADKPATDSELRLAIKKIYAEAPGKPPNVNEVCPLVKDVLAPYGKRASNYKIQKMAEERQFASLRLKAGTHWPK